MLKYWEQRVRENGKFENVYTLGMRGIHDGAMPGGGTPREKAERLHQIIHDQRDMLARRVNTNVAAGAADFLSVQGGARTVSPGAGHSRTTSRWSGRMTTTATSANFPTRANAGAAAGRGFIITFRIMAAPRDYLWLCSTPPALIAEEMTKAYDYGADKVWMLNVGDLKPAELDIEFFLRLAWNPHSWNGTNTYDLLEQQLARDFGPADAPELTSILAEYYRLNFQRKPEHMGFGPTNNLFSTTLNGDEAGQRLEAWQKLSARVDAAGKNCRRNRTTPFLNWSVIRSSAAALAMNEKCLAPARPSRPTG